MMTAIRFFVTVLVMTLLCLFPSSARAQCFGLSLNELDYDQSGTDTEEFIELKGTPGISLTGYELRLVNGLNGSVYHTQPLTGTMPSDGYLVLGAASVPNLDGILDDGGSNLIQNGAPDGVGLWEPSEEAYCDFVSYEGVVPGLGSWPEIGRDSPDYCTQGNSTSLARRELSQPEGEWLEEVCATPGDPNQSPTTVRLESFQATPQIKASLLPALALPALLVLAYRWTQRR